MDSIVLHKYGKFRKSQVEYYKNKLRKKIFWLILYTDENTNKNFISVDVVKYHKNLLCEISSYNELLLYQNDFVEIVNKLEEALNILQLDTFNFQEYKKLVLDAGALMNNLKVGE